MKKNPPMHLTDPEAIKARSRRARALKKTLKKNSEIENLLLDVDVLGMAVHLPHRLGGNGLFPSELSSWALYGLLVAAVSTWSERERKHAVAWAAARHFRASDNPVRVPKTPKHVAALLVRLEELDK